MAYHASLTILSVIEALVARQMVQYSPTFMYGTSASWYVDGCSNGISQSISYFHCSCDSSSSSKDRGTIFSADTKGPGQNCPEIIAYHFGCLANGSQDCWICWIPLERPVLPSAICEQTDRIPAFGVRRRHVWCAFKMIFPICQEFEILWKSSAPNIN